MQRVGTASGRAPAAKVIGPRALQEVRILFGLITLTLFLLCLLCHPGSLSAYERKSIQFRRVSLEDGLSQAAVLATLQDSNGFMWFGTQEGLNRYDGKRYTVFSHDRDDPGSLANNWVWAIHEDRNGVIWVGTDGGGLNRFNATDESFTHFRHDPADLASLSSDRVRVIHEDRSGVLWIGTDGEGLNRFGLENETFERFQHDPSQPASLSSGRIRDLLEDRAGRLWIATDGGGLERFNPETATFTHYRYEPTDSAGLSDDRVRCLYEDRDGVLWIGTYEDGLNRLDPETGAITVYRHDAADPSSLPANGVRAIFQDRDDALWIGTEGGLSLWKPASQSFERYVHDPADHYSLSHNRVASIYQDRGGVLWVGTWGGLNKWNSSTGSFVHYKKQAKNPDHLSNNYVTSFVEDGEAAVWVGTYGGGLNRFDRASEAFSHYTHDPHDTSSLSDDRVMSLALDSAGELWVGTLNGGLNRFNRASGTFTHFRHDPDDPGSLSRDGVTAILEDRSGALWIATYRGGLNRFDYTTGRFIRYRHDPADPSSLSSDRVISIYEDSAGVLWIGTEDGELNHFDPRTGRFSHFRYDPANSSSLSSDGIWTIYEDESRNLWLGTQGGGLNLWGAEDRVAGIENFQQVTKRDGLPNNVINGILADPRGNLWISTNRGISRLSPETGTTRNFDTSHGLQSNEFNFGAYYMAADGQMFFGGINGFNTFYPHQIRDNDQPPRVVLTGLFKMNEPFLPPEPLSKLKEIEFGHGDRVISFEFAAMDYAAPEKNLYTHKLEGFDKNWVELGTMNRAHYTNLEAGHYTFRVKASNNDGVWNEEGLAINIRVNPPPWKTRWAYSFYTLIAASALFTGARSQAKKLRRAAEVEKTNKSLEREIVERKRVAGELRKLSLAVEQSPASVMITDIEGKIEYVNPKFSDLTGYTPEEVLGKSPDFLKSDYLAPEKYSDLWRTVKDGHEWRGELHTRKKNGDMYWEYASVSPIKGQDGSISHIVAVNEDITVRKQYEDKLLRQANFDQLTDLPNRVLAMDRLARALVQGRRKQINVALMFVDLDNFKIVNDTLGHDTGDELLQAIAGRLTSCVRESDTVARFGGDEFLVILPGVRDVAQAEITARRLLESIARPLTLKGSETSITASIGITMSLADGDEPKLLLCNADAAMYKAKESGRNGYRFFTPSMNEQAVRRFERESKLRHALEKEELFIDFQPVVFTHSGRLSGAEALLRWRNPELGLVPPSGFIPIAEDTGLIVPMGEWVLRTACREAEAWRKSSASRLKVAVNISFRQLKETNFVRMVSEALEESGLPADCLECELTEGLLIEDMETTKVTLNDLHDIGVHLSLDDFGTGYSSLSYLKSLPFDTLKIDRAFTAGVANDPETAKLVTSILAMARNLNLEVVAEGVETKAQLEFLRSRGCELVQGYYLSPPLSVESFAKLLAEGGGRFAHCAEEEGKDGRHATDRKPNRNSPTALRFQTSDLAG